MMAATAAAAVVVAEGAIAAKVQPYRWAAAILFVLIIPENTVDYSSHL